jgi:hypothetical protein
MSLAKSKFGTALLAALLATSSQASGYGQLAADLDGDGSIDTGLSAAWTAVTGAKYYEVEVWQASTLGGAYTYWRRFQSPSPDYDFKAKAGRYYKARTRAISFNGTKGAWSALTSVGIQPTDYATAIAQPAAPTLTLKPKGVLVSWTRCADKNYKETIVLRGGVEIGRIKANKFLDGDTVLSAGSNYNYSIQHVTNSDVASTASSTTAITYQLIQAADTDQTVLAAPSGLALALTYQDVDNDSTVDTVYSATWSALTGAVRYEVEVSRSDTAGGTYSVVANLTIAALQANFKVVTGKFYKARIRGFSFNGTPGTWSALTAAANPASYATAIAQPAAPTLTLKPKGVLVSWTRCTDKNYKETIVLRGGVEIGRIKANKYLDADAVLAAGSSYNYSIQHVTNSDVASTASSTTAITYQLIQAADTDQSVLTAPSGLALALTYQDVDNDGTVDTVYKATWSTLSNAVRYEVEVSRSDTAGGTYSVVANLTTTALQANFKVVTGKYYKARIRAFSFNGTPGTWSSLTAAANPAKKGLTLGTVSGVGVVGDDNSVNKFRTPFFVFWDKPTDADYAYTEVILSPADDIDDALAATYRTAGGEIQLTTDYGTAYIFLRHVDRSGNVSAVYPAGGGLLVESRDHIETRDLASNAVTVFEAANPAGSVTISTGTPAVAVSCTSNHTIYASRVKMTAEFRNVSGGQRTFDLSWRADGTVLRTVTITLPDNQAWSGVHLHGAPSGADTVYDALITPVANNVTLSERYMVTEAVKR